MIDSSLHNLRKFVAPEFVFGAGSAALAGQYALNLGMTRVMIVSDPGVCAVGWTAEVERSLDESGLHHVTFTDLNPNPRDSEVMYGAEAYMADECDGIVAVGGGSPMDCAKGIGIVVSNKRHVLDFEGVDNVSRPSPPLVCIPTTAGSSADVSQFAIINDSRRKVKIAIVSKAVVADAALVDPALTTTMNTAMTRDTGLDALTHAIEAYASNAHSPITDLLALKAISLITANLPGAMEHTNDMERRTQQALGSMYAGLAFSNAILGAVHAMAHSLGGLLDLPHGQCNAILLDHVVDYNFPAAPKRYADIARAMGTPVPHDAPMEEQRDLTLETLRGFKRAVGMTTTLEDLGVNPDDMYSLAEKAMRDPCMATNPKNPEVSEIMDVFLKAF